MKSLNKQLKKSKPLELKLMIDLVKTEYPEAIDEISLSELVSKEFGIDCTDEDISRYNQAILEMRQDFELQNRKQQYGYLY